MQLRQSESMRLARLTMPILKILTETLFFPFWTSKAIQGITLARVSSFDIGEHCHGFLEARREVGRIERGNRISGENWRVVRHINLPAFATMKLAFRETARPLQLERKPHRLIALIRNHPLTDPDRRADG